MNREIKSKEADKQLGIEYFEELNCADELTQVIYEVNTIEELIVNSQEITEEEIKEAMGYLKNGKTAGIENLPTDLFKLDIEQSPEILHKLLDYTWKDE